MRFENTHSVAHPFRGEAFPLLASCVFLSRDGGSRVKRPICHNCGAIREPLISLCELGKPNDHNRRELQIGLPNML
jgi:hypothetical protein